VCRYNWLGLVISNAKIQVFFQIKYTEAILSSNTRKLLWFEITKMLIAFKKIKFIVSFITVFGTLFRSLLHHAQLTSVTSVNYNPHFNTLVVALY